MIIFETLFSKIRLLLTTLAIINLTFGIPATVDYIFIKILFSKYLFLASMNCVNLYNNLSLNHAIAFLLLFLLFSFSSLPPIPPSSLPHLTFNSFVNSSSIRSGLYL